MPGSTFTAVNGAAVFLPAGNRGCVRSDRDVPSKLTLRADAVIT